MFSALCLSLQTEGRIVQIVYGNGGQQGQQDPAEDGPMHRTNLGLTVLSLPR